MIETGETDYTANESAGQLESLISAAALERLRESARRDHP